MSGSKTIRESRKLLEPLGYELVGWNKNSHLVYRHNPTGAIARVVNGFDATNRGKANMVLQARRSIREVESISRLWLNFVREQYEVGESEEKLCVISMVSLVKRFRARYPELRFSDKLPGVVFRQSPYVDHVKTGVYIVRGELYGVTPPEAADGVRESVPVERGVDQPGGVEHAGTPPVAAGVDPVPAGEQSAPAVDPEPVESDRPVVVGGLTLPDALVQQLRDALGGGDLEAENALLRETLTQVLASLQGASEAVQTALSLHDVEPRTYRQGRKYRMGKTRLRQLQQLRDAGVTGPMTGESVMGVLGVDAKNAGNALWSFGSAGVMVKTGRGVYRWPEEVTE